MGVPTDLYRPSLALLTDLYQLTMAYAAWRSGVAEREAVFHLMFRRSPFGGGYAVVAGLPSALDWLAALARSRFEAGDLAYLAQLEGADGKPLFSRDFLDYLARAPLAVSVDAMPEGTVAFPQEPLLRISGPIIPCMLAETPLLNLVNFATLVATKAARVVQAAKGEPVLEFGLRRAQGVDGALTASRAAYLGGCAATSNVLAGRLFDIPVRGTHAHSWVMLFDTEREAFAEYAKALPNNCVFLVDTYDSLEGVKNAIEAARLVEARGQKLLGIRLDSGDLAALSVEARRLLDQAGFSDARIYGSNDLDEHVIESLKMQGASIGVWGVGTRLVTGADEPALGGVFKLAAVRSAGEAWRHRIKVSDQATKTSTPGIQQVRRFFQDAEFFADGIYDCDRGWAPGPRWIVDPFDPTLRLHVPDEARSEDLLVPAMRDGQPLPTPSLEEARLRAAHQLASLPSGIKRFLNPHQYPVGLEPGLMELRIRMILDARGLAQ